MNDPRFLIAIGFVSLMIGLSKGGFGAVVVALTTPVLTFAVSSVAEAVGLVLPLLLVGDLLALRVYWGKWDTHYIRVLLPMAAVGALVGLYLLANLPDDILRRILGVFSLIMVAYKLISDNIPNYSYQPRNWHGHAAGLLTGLGSGLANVGAPPFTAYMLLQKVSPQVFIATASLFFFLINMLKMPGVFISGTLTLHQLLSILWTVPLVFVGVWLGRKFIDWVNPKAFDRLMLIALFILGLVLLFNL